MHRGIPFSMQLPANVPAAFSVMTSAHLNAELEKGYADIVAGRLHDLDDVVAEMESDYGI